MKEKIILWLMEGWAPKNPERFIRALVKRYLKGTHHLSSNPIRKEKRSNGPAVM